jgi:bacterioferritin
MALTEFLEHSEEAIDSLETQLGLLKEVSLQNFLQSQIEVAGD